MTNQPPTTNRKTGLLSYRYNPALCILLLIVIACSKKEEPIDEQPIDNYAYEVHCNSCEITYTDQSNTTKTVTNNQGKWTYRLDKKITFELKLSIKTTQSTQQTIQAYILKNDQVVFGDTGYNHANISYDTKKQPERPAMARIKVRDRATVEVLVATPHRPHPSAEQKTKQAAIANG